MKQLISFFSFLFSLVILFSCEPGRDASGDLLFGIKDPEPPRLLTKIISYNLNNEAGESEDSEITYEYVGNKLVSAFDRDGGVTLFDYNNDNQIIKLAGHGVTSTFDYNEKNVSKILTEIDGVSINNIEFSYTGAQLTKVISIHEYLLPIPKKIYLETSYLYTGPNVTKAIQKTGIYLANGELQINPQVKTLTFAYDRKKSPYQLLPKEFVAYLASSESYGPALLSAGTFTMMSISAETTSEPIIYSYVYDKADNPIEMTFKDGYKKFEY